MYAMKNRRKISFATEQATHKTHSGPSSSSVKLSIYYEDENPDLKGQKAWMNRIIKEEEAQRRWEKNYGNFLLELSSKKDTKHQNQPRPAANTTTTTTTTATTSTSSNGKNKKGTINDMSTALDDLQKQRERSKLFPQAKYSIPITSNMQYGWAWNNVNLEAFGSTKAKN